MEGLPLDVSQLTASHSALTAVLSGFALAGLFLLMDRKPIGATEDEVLQHNRSMLFLFLAFIIGSLSSFLYSSMSGFTLDPDLSYYIFQFPSALFAVTSALLLSGISLMFSTLRMGSLEVPSRVISYAVVLFAIYTIGNDLSYASDYYNLHEWSHYSLWIVAGLPIIAAIVTWAFSRFHEFVLRRTFELFAYVTIIGCLVLAAINATLNYQVDPPIEPRLIVLLLSMAVVSFISSWAILLIPWRRRTSHPQHS